MRARISAIVFGCVLANTSILAQELIVLEQLTSSEGGSIETTNEIYSMGGIGDFNGDNIADFALGGRISCAEVSIFYGSAALLTVPLSVSDLDGNNGRRIQATPNHSTPQQCADGPFGQDISAIGDFDLDGFDDFSSGTNFLFLGNTNTDPISDPLTCNLPGNVSPPCAEHFQIYDWLVGASIGDFNHDGFGDLLVADPWFGNGFEGRASVVFGPPNSTDDWSSGFALSQIDGMNGLHLNGNADDNLGIQMSTAGDLNNDDFDDIIVVNPRSGDGATPGQAAVLLGNNIGFANLNVSALNGTVAGFTIVGATSDEGINTASGGGDMNGDGISDVSVARRLDNQLNGVVDVIFGRQNGFSANVDVTTLNGSDGFSITGGNVVALGEDLAMVGDINGDGLADLAFGSFPGLAQEQAGVYVVFGSNSGFTATKDVADLDGSDGFLIQSTRVDSLYNIVAKAGDINNDGVDDLLLGENNSAGDKPWVVFGNAAPKATVSMLELPASNLGGPQPQGQSVNELFGSVYDDVDAFAGVAVRGAAADSGTWQAQIGGGSWQDVASSSDLNALVLQPDDLLRFLPDPDSVAGDTGTLSVRLWDGRWRDAGAAVDISSAINALGGFANDDNLITLQVTIVDIIFKDGFENQF
ncbi:integrin alpha [Marinicella litoralis]|uniref:FG-GAP repeat protein n=1 Tax=Marinicella litoralis TaxID=644220 RepID=A0A4R6XR34_9GAMM|nr:integrin alpha [Marinicella litoralis]TDR20700.1 hypothetical protein C8D91_1678 [Marinicella litoralis]